MSNKESRRGESGEINYDKKADRLNDEYKKKTSLNLSK